MKYTDAWCSTYASAVAITAGLTDIIPTECGCGKHIELFKKLGSWQENDAYVPKPGDYIFYDWQDSGVETVPAAPIMWASWKRSAGQASPSLRATTPTA